MFRLYRVPEPGEFIVVGGDTAQGGTDSNYGIFLSKTRGDVVMVMQKQGMATQMTPFYVQALHKIYEWTKVKPAIALERQNGGISAMYDLFTSNIEGKYTIFYMRDETGKLTEKMGWDTNSATRPKMLGEYLTAFNAGLIRHYDEETIDQHSTFIVTKSGKPEGAPNSHDDGVMSSAIAWQLYQIENPPMASFHATRRRTAGPKRARFHV